MSAPMFATNAKPRLVSAESLAVFRILTGMLLVSEGIRLIRYHAYLFRLPEFHLRWDMLEWVPVLPPAGYYVLATLLLVAALALIAGAGRRIPAASAALLYGYYLLTDAAYYDLFAYLLLLVLILFSVTDTDGALSAAVWKRSGSFWSDSGVPEEHYRRMAALFCVTLFFTGVAKIQPDWVSGQVVRTFFARGEYPVWASFLDRPIGWALFSWMALIGLLSAAVALWTGKARIEALAFLGLYFLLQIAAGQAGKFPMLMVSSIVLFIRRDAVRAILKAIGKRVPRLRFPVVREVAGPTHGERPSGKLRLLLMVFFAFLFLLPVRHLLIKGKVDWTGEGAAFSWRMYSHYRTINMFKVLAKNEVSKQSFPIKLQLNHLQIFYLVHHPASLRQVACILADRRLSDEPKDDLFLSFLVSSTLNGRPAAFLIDYDANLLGEPRRVFTHNPWITTDVPLPEQGRWWWIRKKPVEF